MNPTSNSSFGPYELIDRLADEFAEAHTATASGHP